ncbi:MULTISPECIES: hypothetical protein [Nocardia]|uniref:hypothetical protein n=1 Tax=Nocardia TaxID=1817 RepID=UPI0007A4036D|nr:hypothetical protein [Nocardia nova]
MNRARLDTKLASYLLASVRSEMARSVVRSWSAQWMGCDLHETAATRFVTSVGMALADPREHLYRPAIGRPPPTMLRRHLGGKGAGKRDRPQKS